jgi:hypothetical protein
MRMLLPRVGPLDGVVLAAVLVVTPLALVNLGTRPKLTGPEWATRLEPVVAWMQVVAGAACAVSFVIPAGPIAGALVAPWMGLSLLAGALGASRVIRLRSMDATRARVSETLSALLSMPLAVVWAWGEVTGSRALDMLWMVRIHGMANAHGFALCGLLAWALAALTPGRTEAPLPR